MSWIRDLFGPLLSMAGVPVPQRSAIDFVGDGVTIADNPSKKRTTVTIPGVSSTGVPSSRTITTTSPLTGGGSLGANRVIGCNSASAATPAYLAQRDNSGGCAFVSVTLNSQYIPADVAYQSTQYTALAGSAPTDQVSNGQGANPADTNDGGGFGFVPGSPSDTTGVSGRFWINLGAPNDDAPTATTAKFALLAGPSQDGSDPEFLSFSQIGSVADGFGLGMFVNGNLVLFSADKLFPQVVIDMDGNAIRRLPAPTDAADAVRKSYVDAATAPVAVTDSGSIVVDLANGRRQDITLTGDGGLGVPLHDVAGTPYTFAIDLGGHAWTGFNAAFQLGSYDPAPAAVGVTVFEFRALGSGAFQCVGRSYLDVIKIGQSTSAAVTLGASGSTLGVYGATPITKPAVNGSRGGNAALASLLTQLAALGLIADASS